MLTREEFIRRFSRGTHLLDGATGTSLYAAGMPRGCCMAEWILAHPEPLLALQRAYMEAGSEILYAPTLRAHPLVLGRFGLESEAGAINEMLVSLSRRAAPGCLIAGNLTTLKGFADPADRSRQTDEYRRQISALIAGGADFIAAETLLTPVEARAVLAAAREEGNPAVLVTFAARPDGTLRSGDDAEEVFRLLTEEGASALGVNCLPADESLPELILRLRRSTALPLAVKPNTGGAAVGTSPVDQERFARILAACAGSGANLLGGCCGTTPEYIAALSKALAR